jgi:hypothetical protein
MVTALEWVRLYLGQSIDFDDVYGPQCVDAVNSFVTQTAPGSGRFYSATASLMVFERLRGWQWEPNSPDNFPPPGAVVVWGYAPAIGVGQAGHTAVCLGADTALILSLDQNWGAVKFVRAVVHDYRGVVGWHLRLAGKAW